MSLAQIARLTPYQVLNVYCRGEPEGGAQLSRDDARFKKRFDAVWKRAGLTDAQIAQKWEQEGHGRRRPATEGSA